MCGEYILNLAHSMVVDKYPTMHRYILVVDMVDNNDNDVFL